MRIAIAGPLSERMALAVEGLAARGHAVAAAASRATSDVVVGMRPVVSAWAASQCHARAVVLALDAVSHARWNLIERWAWSVSGGFGIVTEDDVPQFLARIPEPEQGRLALWPATRSAGTPVTHPDTTQIERLIERAHAHRAAGPGRSALFVDRDGTLIVERHHLSDPAGVTLLPGVGTALRAARAAGHPVVVISNQAGVGRGLYDEAAVHATMRRLRELLRVEGVELDAVRFCPHAPDAGCDCRKPETRLVREVADDLRISLVASAMVGDKWIDVETGHAVRGAGILVRTGHGAEELSQARPAGARSADLLCDDLPAAVRWFLAQMEQ